MVEAAGDSPLEEGTEFVVIIAGARAPPESRDRGGLLICLNMGASART